MDASNQRAAADTGAAAAGQAGGRGTADPLSALHGPAADSPPAATAGDTAAHQVPLDPLAALASAGVNVADLDPAALDAFVAGYRAVVEGATGASPDAVPSGRAATDAGTGATADSPETIHLHVDRPPLPTDRPAGVPEMTYGEPRGFDGGPLPMVRDPDGDADPDQLIQGPVLDCDVVAVAAAVVNDRPEVARGWLRSLSEPVPRLVFHEATEPGEATNWVSHPTGRQLDMTLGPDLPVQADDPDRSAGMDVTEAGELWPGYVEKGIAGMPSGEGDGEETGYDGLEQLTGTQLARTMTQLTGEPAFAELLDHQTTVGELTSVLENHAGDPMVIGFGLPTEDDDPLDSEVVEHGIVLFHGYTRMTYEDGTVQLRNPWGMDHPDPMTVEQLAEVVAAHQAVYVTVDREGQS